MKIYFDIPNGDAVSVSARQGDGAPVTKNVAKWGEFHDVFKVKAGRISVVDAPLPSIGPTTLRPDGRYTLDLLDQSEARAVVENLDGRIMEVTVDHQRQRRGWDAGEYYMLKTDANGDLLPYPGERHRKVYLTRGPNAWGKPEIAAHAGVSEATVTTNWLIARPQYGGSEAMPLTYELALAIYNATMHLTSEESRSDWYLFERGYAYPSQIGELYCRGEDELHPMVFTGWGAPGWFSAPGANIHSYGPQNTIFKDIHFTPEQNTIFRAGYCVIVDNMYSTGDMENEIGSTKYATLRRSRFKDNFKDVPSTPIDGEKWAAHANRHQSLYSSGGRSLLIEDSFFDHAGWADGYDPYLSVEHGQPPNMYSHNLYIAHSTYDVTLANVITMRGASFGAQVRASGQQQFCMFVDNNIAFNSIGGDYQKRGPIGAYNLAFGNIITQSGYKRVFNTTTSLGTPVNAAAGAYNWGIEERSFDGSMVANAIMHFADPDDPDDIARKPSKPSDNSVLSNADQKLYDDTVSFGFGQNNWRIDDLDTARLLQTTIQRYTAQRLDTGAERATLDDLAALMMQPETDIGLETQRMCNYFLAATGFGDFVQDRTDAAECVFLPDPRGEGFRWDNVINWSTKDMPGRNHADTVNLGGARAVIGRSNAIIDTMTFGGGTLEAAAGCLTANSFVDPADVKIRRAGQVHVGNIPSGSHIDVQGGMLKATATAAGSVSVGGTGMVLLPDAAIMDNVTVRGHRARLGWDGSGNRTLTINGALSITSGAYMTVSNWDKEPDPLDGQADAMYLYPGLRVEGTGWAGTVGYTEIRSKYGPDRCRVWLYDIEGTPVTETIVYNHDYYFIGYPDGVVPDPIDPPVLVEYSTRFTPVSYGLPVIRPFRSGAIGDGVTEPTVTPTVNLSCDLHLDLTGIGAGSYPLIQAATVSGTFGEITVSNLAAGLTHTVNVTASGVTLVVS